MIDPDKQFIEDVEVVKPDFTDPTDDNKIEPPKDLTQYGLVAKVAKNGLVLLWEWMPLEEARALADKNFMEM